MPQFSNQQKRSISFSFEQIKPKLADEKPETTIAAWFKVTDPNVPSLTDNFKSEDSLDSYLGLVDDYPSREPEFLVNRPCQHRPAGPTHHPTSYLDKQERQPRNVTYGQSKYFHQSGYRYPAGQSARVSTHEPKDSGYQYYYPSTVDETSTNPQSTPPSESNGWVTYEYDRENVKKGKQRFATSYYNYPMHSERVSMFYKRDPTWDFPAMYNSY